MKYKFLIAAGGALMLALPSQADLTVAPATPAEMVAAILGSGITANNITYTGAGIASGKFAGGASAGITLDKGILLTSGSRNNAPGPNNQDSATQANYLPGDANLNGLIPGYQTYDATVLEFDFVSAGGDVYFNYAFASEEYNEYTHSSYNDVFGFFLDGENIALIPGTTTPVSINNVNGGNPFGFNAQHPDLYNNNDLNDGGPFFNIQYDGFTDAFTAKFLGLGAGTHHIKLAIADAGDYVLDSGVFIEAGSFDDNPHPPGAPDGGSTLGLALLGLFGLGLFGKRHA